MSCAHYPSTHASQAMSGAVVTKFQRPIGFPSRMTWCIQPGRPVDAISSVLLRSGLGIFPIQTRSDVVMSKRPYSELVEFFTTGYPLDVDTCFRTCNLPTCRTLKIISNQGKDIVIDCNTILLLYLSASMRYQNLSSWISLLCMISGCVRMPVPPPTFHTNLTFLSTSSRAMKSSCKWWTRMYFCSLLIQSRYAAYVYAARQIK